METNSFKKCPTLEEIVDRAILQVTPDTSVLEAAVLMSREQAKGCVVVVDGALLLGILTERDVVKITVSGVDLSRTEIARVIAQPIISLTLDENQNVLTALSVMRQHRIRHLPLVDNRGQLVGLVTQEQIYEAIAPLEKLEEISLYQRLEAERHQVEVELKQREAFLRSIYDGAEQSIFVVDVTEANDFRYVSFNRSAQQSVGVSLEDIQDKTPEEVFGTETGTIFRQNYQRCLQADSSITYEDHFIFNDRPVWTLTTLAPLRNQEGRIYRIVGTVVEITDRKQAEAALRNSEAEFRAMFNISSVGMAQVDITTRRFLRVNTAFCAIAGYTEAELLTLTVDDINHPDDRDRQLYINLLNGDSYQSEKRYLRKDGSTVWVLATGNIIRDAQGQPLRAFAIIQDISERARLEAERQAAETALRVSEESYRLMFESHPNPMWFFDPETLAFLEVNQAAIAHYGYSREEFLQMTIADIRPPSDVPALHYFNNHLIPGQPHIGIWQHCKKDGTTIDVEVIAYAFPVAGMQANLALIQDITELKRLEAERQQAETAMRLSEARHQLILDLTDTASWDLDIASGKVLWSEYMFQLFGLTPGAVEPSYSAWCNCVHPEDTDRLESSVANHLQNRTLYNEEYRVVYPDGSIHWVLSKGRGIYDATGQPVQIVGITMDISDRKFAEQKIAEQAALIDIATEAFLVQDLDNCILFCSKGAERLYGWTAAEILGKIVHELFNTEPRSQLAEGLNRVLAQGFWQGELEQATKSGKKIIVASRWTLVRDESGQPKSILVVNSDITEKKNLEEQFYRAQRLESIGTLASGIAHDFNNLLTPILAVAQLLPLKFRDLDDQTQHFLTMLEESAKRGTNLVKQLLSFSRGTQGKQIIIQLGHLLSELVTVAQSTFPKSINISREIPTREMWLISADSTQIHQVFMNILVNARDAMPNGGNLNISAENRYLDEKYARMNLEAHVGSYVVIKISDTGTGIPPELMERIFDPFFTTKEVGKGTGLGLATVLGIVKNHGGFVKVDSEVGKGTQFEVFLPAVEGAVSQPNSENELQTGNGELILIVDDEQSIQEITKTSLENYNYKTLLASDGIEAIATYAKHKEEISVVLIDLMMPNLDGFTAIRAMQLINPQVKVIPTSGLPASAQKTLPANIKTFLLKPYTLEELLNAINVN